LRVTISGLSTGLDAPHCPRYGRAPQRRPNRRHPTERSLTGTRSAPVVTDSIGGRRASSTRRVSRKLVAGAGVEEPTTGEVIDATARRRYVERVRELQAEIDDAEADPLCGATPGVVRSRHLVCGHGPCGRLAPSLPANPSAGYGRALVVH
jgi:hypothetical protein